MPAADMALPGGLGRLRAFPDRRKNLPPENISPAEGPPVGGKIGGVFGWCRQNSSGFLMFLGQSCPS
ncbi:MAG: hypothetical protein QXH59_10325, partial [Candidatus Caldarchaeum sp.]